MYNKKGFTLVELMIVVAIIGILAAIAIPNFTAMQYKSKRAEVPSNVDGIKTAEVAYEAAFDTYVEESSYQPDADVGKAERAWEAGSAFDTLGWAPDGKVRGAYRVYNYDTDFYVYGMCDVDGDSETSSYVASEKANAVMSTENDVY
jgi:prepilin-type N-terminal cleavage/methylation domain-containing protein